MHPHQVPDWALARSAAMNRFPPLAASRAAVIVVDMQAAFVGETAAFPNPNTLDIVPNINRLCQAARTAGAAICWSRHTVVGDGPGRQPDWQRFEGSLSSFSAPHLRAGAPGHALYAGLDAAAHDLVFDKYRFSCFVNAAIDLDGWLRTRGVEDIFVVGTISNCCCESTARDAAMRDYRVRFLSDATAALTDEEHAAALLSAAAIVGEVITTDMVIAQFAASHASLSEGV
ncbi:cysteine hydrolase family protein [Flavisphingomonas formosensis]|uniref:cysteine hydrolase family protein n=1 Tax=Flavisphingomonas formosensis TaxID=861534 RepID=UPI0012FBC128|nr:cysteine hydrolase [Sphingomonas formosensis]